MGLLERRQIRSDPKVQLLLYFNLLFSIQYVLLIGPLVLEKVSDREREGHDFDKDSSSGCLLMTHDKAAPLPQRMHNLISGVWSVYFPQLLNYEFRSGLQRGASGPVFILWFLAEPARLYYGFSGNLQEKVSPEGLVSESLYSPFST